jgi:hypothetical protein
MIDGHVEGHINRVVTGHEWELELWKMRCKVVGGGVARGEDVEVG